MTPKNINCNNIIHEERKLNLKAIVGIKKSPSFDNFQNMKISKLHFIPRNLGLIPYLSLTKFNRNSGLTRFNEDKSQNLFLSPNRTRSTFYSKNSPLSLNGTPLNFHSNNSSMSSTIVHSPSDMSSISHKRLFSDPKKKIENLFKQNLPPKKDFYKEVFRNKDKIFITKQKDIINNKLNIIYAENEEHYQRNLKKINNSSLKTSSIIKHDLIPNIDRINKKLSTIKDKVTFVKCVFDYAYPEYVMLKNKIGFDIKHKLNKNFKTEMEKADLQKIISNQRKTNILQGAVHIKHIPMKLN